ncbi:YqjF family protein [Vampirovibrio sp.]|uniref:YqjF family protein n=1 Tax=Vampirovibrio sp. TaxID=2717857 RepID=UPI003592EA7F
MIRLPFNLQQRWDDLLFLHYPIDPQVLQAQLPNELVPDVKEGQAWLSVVPFSLTYWLPGLAIPWRFHELNLRTYVKPASRFQRNEGGVYFFCLDANHRISVEAARFCYHLNYLNAEIHVNAIKEKNSNGSSIHYQSKRMDQRGNPAEFEAVYQPTREPLALHSKAVLQSWLTERYRLYTTDGKGNLYTATIKHNAWPLESAEFEVKTNGLLQAHGFSSIQNEPSLTTYTRSLNVTTHSATIVKFHSSIKN